MTSFGAIVAQLVLRRSRPGDLAWTNRAWWAVLTALCLVLLVPLLSVVTATGGNSGWIHEAAQQQNLELHWASAFEMFKAVDNLIQPAPGVTPKPGPVL